MNVMGEKMQRGEMDKQAAFRQQTVEAHKRKGSLTLFLPPHNFNPLPISEGKS